jgi:hypothetical protein
MTQTYDIDTLYQKWIRLGWMATGNLWPEEVDPELLIVQTTHAARTDSRLFKWLLTWFKDNNDLINTKRLLRILDNADTAVLGAVIEIAIKESGNHNLKTILTKCKKKPVQELLFTGMEDIETFVAQEKAKTHEIYSKWGLYCSMYEFYNDANRSRAWILEHNRNLALRALYGPNIRAEIMYYLLNHDLCAIKNIAQHIGYTYSSVYNEVTILIKNGFVTKSSDSWHSLQINTRSLDIFRLII